MKWTPEALSVFHLARQFGEAARADVVTHRFERVRRLRACIGAAAATAARMRLITPAPAVLNRLHPLARHRYQQIGRAAGAGRLPAGLTASLTPFHNERNVSAGRNRRR
jgi:hypothetical protein